MGKRKFGFQVALVSVSFVCLLIRPFPVLHWAWLFFYGALFILLGIANILTILSGFDFLSKQKAHFASEAFSKYVLAVGVGLLPKAPGTWGSLIGLLLVFLTRWNGMLYGLTFTGLILWGAWAYQRIKDPDPDPQYIVIDEVCGIFVTFMMIPMTWTTALLGFILFRLFDIFKPFPVRLLERIPRYWGIMADDLGAGLYAWIILFILFK